MATIKSYKCFLGFRKEVASMDLGTITLQGPTHFLLWINDFRWLHRSEKTGESCRFTKMSSNYIEFHLVDKRIIHRIEGTPDEIMRLKSEFWKYTIIPE